MGARVASRIGVRRMFGCVCWRCESAGRCVWGGRCVCGGGVNIRFALASVCLCVTKGNGTHRGTHRNFYLFWIRVFRVCETAVVHILFSWGRVCVCFQESKHVAHTFFSPTLSDTDTHKLPACSHSNTITRTGVTLHLTLTHILSDALTENHWLETMELGYNAITGTGMHVL